MEMQRRTFFTDDYARSNPEMLEWLHAAYWDGRPEMPEYLLHVQARQAHSVRAEIDKIVAPTLVVVGSLDTHAGGTGSHYDQSVELHQLIADSEFAVLPGLRHGLFWEGMTNSIELLRPWLAKNTGL
jgi:pimeloyl-ACP methyl ester carboxylesterase